MLEILLINVRLNRHSTESQPHGQITSRPASYKSFLQQFLKRQTNDDNAKQLLSRIHRKPVTLTSFQATKTAILRVYISYGIINPLQTKSSFHSHKTIYYTASFLLAYTSSWLPLPSSCPLSIHLLLSFNSIIRTLTYCCFFKNLIFSFKRTEKVTFWW